MSEISWDRSSLEHNRAHPEVSADTHRRRKILKLGEELAAKKKIYLDLCFWIRLRDAWLGKSSEPVYETTLGKLTKLVDEGGAVCPLSDAILYEVLKQTDSNSQLATVRLIDRLSAGVVLANEELRANTELAHFLDRLDPKISVQSLDELVWTKPISVVGAVLPHHKGLDPVEQLVLQKGWIDYSWNISFEQLMQIPRGLMSPLPDMAPLAEKLNEGNRQHAHEIRSFQKLVIDETIGVLDLMRGVLCDVMLAWHRREGGDTSLTPEQRKTAEDKLFNMIANAISLKTRELAPRLRTAYIKAKCFAAVRWDQKRLLTANDLYDFHHAAAAVGYCDAFFTERPLSVLLNANHVAVAKEFDCYIEHETEKVVNYLTLIA